MIAGIVSNASFRGTSPGVVLKIQRRNVVFEIISDNHGIPGESSNYGHLKKIRKIRTRHCHCQL